MDRASLLGFMYWHDSHIDTSGLAILQAPDDLLNWLFQQWIAVELGDEFKFFSSKCAALNTLNLVLTQCGC
ncbi:uncharacterized protein ARMOST_14650 [Armillaria ostoyae]|uniref:Uncharacterized protein n=1 Tax=Armillaria ostoyae TaxID=47428 RepID=A0A284RR52_ARMOS|nr:uncharacterized protein ARMOST_14650 [Armillaria ostoyae]